MPRISKQSHVHQVSRLAMLSLLAIFRDIIPGYRIRPPTEKELATQLSKEVKKLHEFESGLLAAYQVRVISYVPHRRGVQAFLLFVAADACCRSWSLVMLSRVISTCTSSFCYHNTKVTRVIIIVVVVVVIGISIVNTEFTRLL
jgi:hypothetical protein